MVANTGGGMGILIVFMAGIILTLAVNETTENGDGEESRKILGSSVVTSVSVIMDTGNGSKAVYADPVGKPIGKPATASELGSPINLLNPDRYEFYTFDDNGELIKRLMSLDEIKGIIATGDTDELDLDSFTSQGYLPEKKVNDVVNNVQNVLKEEMETHKNTLDIAKPLYDTPDVSDSWSMILPAIFGNSGDDIKPEKPVAHVTPDTIMLEPTHHYPSSIKTSKRPSTTTSAPKITTSRPTSFIQILHQSPSGSTTSKPKVKTTTKTSNVEPSSAGMPLYTSNQIYYTLKPVPSPSHQTETEDLKNMPHVEIYTNSKTSTEIPMISPGTDTRPTTLFVKPITKQPASTNVFLSSTQMEMRTSPSSTPSATEQTPQSSSTPILISSSSTLKEEPSKYTPVFTFAPTSTLKPKPTTTQQTSKVDSSSTPSASKTTAVTTEQTTKPAASTSSTADEITKSEFVSIYKLSSAAAEQATKPVSVPTSTYKSPTSSTEQGYTLISNSTASTEKVNPTKQDVTIPQQNVFSTWRPHLIPPEKLPTTTEAQLFTWRLPDVPQNTESFGTTFAETLTELLTQKFTEKETTSMPNRNIITPEGLPTVYEAIGTTQGINQQNISNTEVPPSELLDQLLLTTNVYEINTELAQNFSQSDNSDERFITSTEEETRLSESRTDLPTTESLKYEATTTDRTLIDSIEQLLSQAVGNVGEVLAAVNETDKIKDLLETSVDKDMEAVQKETATFASDMVDHSTKAEDIITATPTLDESDIMNESIGSLLSQVYGLNEDSVTTMKINMTNNYYPTTVMYRKAEDVGYDNGATTEVIYGLKEETELPSTSAESEISTTSEDSPTTVVEYQGSDTIATEKRRDDEVKTTTPTNGPQSIEIYIEKVYNTSNRLNVSSTTDRNFIDVLNAEETGTVVGKIGSSKWNVLSSPGSSKINSYTEKNSEASPTTTDSKVKEPTTIVIIKRTERPVSSEVPPKNEEATTMNYEKIEMKPIVTAEKEDDENDDSANDSPDHPSVEVYINETNSSTVSSTEQQPPNLTTKDATKNDGLTVQNTTDAPAVEQKLKLTNVTSPEINQQNSWTLVSTIAPHSNPAVSQNIPPMIHSYVDIINPPAPIDLEAKPMQGFGLEESTSTLDADIYQFTQLCNELAFGFWKSVTKGVSTARSVFISPFGATSLLAMVFLGARGATSGEMNEILKLDDMVTFNPHLIFKNVSESIKSNGAESGVAVSAIIRELFSDRGKGKLLHFYKERAKAFYDGFVEEVSFKEIGDVIRRRTNLQVKKHSNGKINEFLKDSSITPKPPLVALSVNVFQTDCSAAVPPQSPRDSELHFSVSPSVRQRRLVPVPAVVYDDSHFLAGYEPSLDATAAAVGSKDSVVSTIYVLPGSPGQDVPGDGLGRLEKRLVESSFKKGAWSRLLRSLQPRPGLLLQLPVWSHRSLLNATTALRRLGLGGLLKPGGADLRGLNGAGAANTGLYLAEVLQVNQFGTCAERRDRERHEEIYPAGMEQRDSRARFLDLYRHDPLFQQQSISELIEEPRDYQRAFHDPLHDPSYLSLPLPLRPRQARLPEEPSESPRLRFDRPFMYFIRHNPTGLILHMGRFNPRLLP